VTGTASVDDDVVLAIDLGTGGPKTAYVALSGEVLDHEHRRVELQALPDGGAIEDPEEWWSAVVASAAELAERSAVPPERIVAVACTGQWGSTIPVDGGGHAVGPCLLWLDQRGGDLARRQLGGRLSVEGYRPRAAFEWIRRAGGAPNPDGNDPLGHRLWIRHEEPDVYARTAVFLEPVDYLNMRLCGTVAATQVTMTLSWLTDNRRLDVTAYDPTLVSLAGVDPAKLPSLVPIRSVIGHVGSAVADQLGIPTGTPVVGGLPDLHSATLGSGAVDDFHGHLAISTSAWVGCHSPDKRTSLAHQMATVPSALPGRYVLANNHDCGGVSLEWLRDHIIAPDDGLGRGSPSLADLDAAAARASAGAGGVLFAPWLKGERSPVSDTSMRAGFLNLGITTNRVDLVRAVLEGVAHQLGWILDTSEKVVRHSLGDLHAVGGGAQSDVWCQIHADVLNRPIHRVDRPLLANVRGAALFAGLVTGRLSIDQLGGRAVIDRVFTPDRSVRAVHEELHREFLGLSKAQKAMYHRLDRSAQGSR
jgi:xylulokinase